MITVEETTVPTAGTPDGRSEEMMMATNDAAYFPQLQLALANVLANPSFDKVLGNVKQEREKLRTNGNLARLFESSGAPLPEGVKASLVKDESPETARKASITIQVCVNVGGFDHCAAVTIQSPIEVDVY